MKIILLLIGILLFTAYFYAIGAGYFSFLPFIIFLIVGLVIANNNKDKFNITQINNKYIFLVVWMVVNGAVVLLLTLLGVGILESLLGILGLNILAVLVSYPLQLVYATEVAYISYYLVCIAIFVYALITPGFSAFLTLEYMLGFTMAFLAFIYFIVPLYYTIDEDVFFHFLLVSYSTLSIVLYSEITNKYYAILTLLVLLTVVLYGIKYVLDQIEQPQEAKKISVRKIIAGERVLPVLKKQKNHSTALYAFAQKIIPRFPQYTKYFLEGLNILFLVVFLYLYISGSQNTIQQLGWVHWGIILSFLANIYIFKTIHYTSILQKIGMFLGMNIFVYIVLFSLMPQISGTMLIYAIGLNILYSIMLFNLESLFPKLARTKLDYFTALGVDIVVVITNIILFTYVDISGQIIFALAFLYSAVKILIILYTLDMIRRRYKQASTDEMGEDASFIPHQE